MVRFQPAATRGAARSGYSQPSSRSLERGHPRSCASMAMLAFMTFMAAIAIVLFPTFVSAQEVVEETDDAPDALCRAAADVGWVEFPFELEDSLEPDDASTRVDFYRFAAEPGLALRADMTDHFNEPDTMRNPLLGLFNSNCDWLDQNDDLVEPGVNSLDARVDFSVPDDGTFILAAAASPDDQFNGSSDDTGTYTLRIDLAPAVEPPALDPPIVTIARAVDGRIDVELRNTSVVAGYNIYRDARYFMTVRPGVEIQQFRFDGGAGAYCLVAFEEYHGTTRHSVCSESFQVGPGGPTAGGPSAPGQLRATIYSPGVVELFWLPSIDDGRVVGYRIRRDGIEIGTTDGRSVYERGLEPSRIYRYRISAIDDEGLEGPPARLDIQPIVRAEVPPQELIDGDAAPEPPGALTGVLYSPGVAEIFWALSPDHSSIAGYAVSRDGERVAFHKGASHFEDHLPIGSDTLWSVVAVTTDGTYSTPRRLRLADGQFTPLDAAPSNAIIRRDTYAALVGHVFDVYVGDLYSSSLHALYGLDERMRDLEIRRDTSANPVLFEFACGDGRADLALTWSGTNYGEIYEWNFNQCGIEGMLYDGALYLHKNARGPTFRSTGLSLQRNTAIVTSFSGMAQWWYSQTAFFDNIGSWDTESFALSSRIIDGDLDITDSTSRFAYGYETSGRFSASLSGGFDVRSDLTGGALVQVSTPLKFSYVRGPYQTLTPANTWNFTSGQLELIAEDGSRVLLDADTGDDATVRITIDNERGPDTFVTQWTHWQSRLRFDRYPLDSPDRITRAPALSDATPGPAINPDNYEALLDQAFDLYAGIGYYEALQAVQQLIADTEPVESSIDRGIRTDRLDCNGNGEATVRRIDDGASGEPITYRIELDSCEAEGFRLDGRILGDGLSADGHIWELSAERFSWQDSAGSDGLLRGRTFRQAPGEADDSCIWRSESVNLYGLPDDPEAIVVTSDTNSYTFQDESGFTFFTVESPGTRFETRDAGAQVLLEGGLSFASRASGGHSIQVLARGLTTNPNADTSVVADGGFAAGGLVMYAEDGSGLYLGDFIGSEDSSHIIIANREGRYAIQAPWTSWQAHLPAVWDSVCGQR